ncbi:hypothetical protein LIA77_07328 [Sarocladium implicatum]|nr:hypothetical protein LIA77_07328 [Sarocladium implicatum]
MDAWGSPWFMEGDWDARNLSIACPCQSHATTVACPSTGGTKRSVKTTWWSRTRSSPKPRAVKDVRWLFIVDTVIALASNRLHTLLMPSQLIKDANDERSGRLFAFASQELQTKRSLHALHVM